MMIAFLSSLKYTPRISLITVIETLLVGLAAIALMALATVMATLVFATVTIDLSIAQSVLVSRTVTVPVPDQIPWSLVVILNLASLTGIGTTITMCAPCRYDCFYTNTKQEGHNGPPV